MAGKGSQRSLAPNVVKTRLGRQLQSFGCHYDVLGLTRGIAVKHTQPPRVWIGLVDRLPHLRVTPRVDQMTADAIAIAGEHLGRSEETPVLFGQRGEVPTHEQRRRRERALGDEGTALLE